MELIYRIMQPVHDKLRELADKNRDVCYN